MNMYPNLWNILQQQETYYTNKAFATYGAETLEFKDLQKSVVSLAGHIQTSTSSKVVAIPIKNPLKAVTAIFAVLIAEKAYWSVDESILEKTESSFAEPFFILDENQFDLGIENKLNPKLSSEIKPNTPFCWATSSGRLATYKITEHTYLSILEDSLRQIKSHTITSLDALDILSPLGFSASLSVIFPALLSGASIHFYKGTSKASIYEFWKQKGVTMSTLTPTLFRGITQLKYSFNDLKIRFICLSGERVKLNDLELFKNNFNAECILQLALASSETRAIAEFLFKASDSLPPDNLFKYKPIAGKKITIVDDLQQNQPQEKEGFIVVTSAVIGTKYINQSTNFTHLGNGERRFISSDKAKLTQDNQLILIQSEDRITKYKGEFIDLDALEAFISNQEGVFEVYCSLNKEVSQLFIFVSSQISDFKLKKNINTRLGLKGYLLHNQNYELPKTNSGKLDISLILNSLQNIIKPSEEDQLLQCFQKIFPLVKDETLKKDHFFDDLGGDSITAMLFINELSTLFDIELEPSFIYLNPFYDQLKKELDTYVEYSLTSLNTPKSELENILIIPPRYGALFNYEYLINELKGSYNIYIFRFCVTKNKRFLTINTITEQAAAYLNSASIRFSKIIGYSISGYLAYNIGADLNYKPHLVLIDTPLYRNKKRLERLKKDSFRVLSKMGQLVYKSRRNDLKQKAIHVFKTHYLKKTSPTQNLQSESIHAYYDNILTQLYTNPLEIPQTDFPMSVFVATDQNFYVNDIKASHNWEQYNSQIREKVYLEGTHNTILNPENSHRIAVSISKVASLDPVFL